MIEKEVSNSESILKDIVESPYKYGFKTEIETEQFPKGVNNKIISQISDKKKRAGLFKTIPTKVFCNLGKARSTRVELFEYCRN